MGPRVKTQSPRSWSVSCLYIFFLWCKHQDWVRGVWRPLPKGLLNPDHWCHLGVISKCSEEHSFSFRGTRVSLQTKHRFSIKHRARAGVARGWILGKWESYLSQCSPLPGLTTLGWPNTVSHERKIDPKKKNCGEEVWDWEPSIKKMAYDIFFLWKKERVEMKGTETRQKYKNETELSLRTWGGQKRTRHVI